MVGVMAIGPSLVDIAVKLSPAEFRSWCSELGLSPGGWRSLHDRTEVSRLIQRLLREPVAHDDEFDELTRSAAVSMSAGSSTLGMLSAMPERVREESTYVSTLAQCRSRMDPFSAFFTDAVRGLRLSHHCRVVPGHNPVGFVVYEPANPNRVLATYAGVATETVPPVDHAEPAELVLIDTYELLTGPLGDQLHELILGRTVPIGLSLGNAAILTGTVRQRLRRYVEAGALNMIFGNSSEYRVLYPELPPDVASVSGFRQHPVRRQVRFCLLTDGANGMAAHYASDYATAPATTVATTAVVNTSGAGDTSAGVFAAGALERMEPTDLLTLCTELAGRVVRVQGSRIVG